MDGIIILDKESGVYSRTAGVRVAKIFGEKKFGHIGTLDPMATGVLPILIGNYTKLSKYLIEHNKSYIAKIKLGQKTSTGDREGYVIETNNIPKELDINYIKQVLNGFLGKQTQTPPIYSAIKVNGKKLYEYAREKKEVDIPKREIEINDIELLNFNKEEDIIEIKVNCSKGTYIRTLCEDIANKLHTVGYMQSLNRIRVDKFFIEESYTLEDLENGNFKLISMRELFKEFPKIELNKRKLELFYNGVNLSFELKDGIYNIYNEEKYIGLGIIKNKLLKRDVVE